MKSLFRITNWTPCGGEGEGSNQGDTQILLKKNYLFLFLAVLGLRCYAQAFSSCGAQGLLFVVHGLLTVEASLVVEHGSRHVGSAVAPGL